MLNRLAGFCTLTTIALLIGTSTARISPARYVSEPVWIMPGETHRFEHSFNVQPLELDVWCATMLSTAPAQLAGPAVPCYDWPEAKVTVISVTKASVTIYNAGPGNALVAVVASP
jgi:hypothetical protein